MQIDEPAAPSRSFWERTRVTIRHTIPHLIGLDRAIAYIVVGRIIQALGSVGNVLLIIHLLTPAEQGYYYALWSLVALQTVFELGFSFVVLQIAAHERAHLIFHPDGSISGSGLAHIRLASALQRTVKWYAVGAVLMGILLSVAGTIFFSTHTHPGIDVSWSAPLHLTVVGCVVTFSAGPILSFLEGCGQVATVARMRFFQSTASVATAWTAMLSHHGLYAPGLILLAQGTVAAIFIATRRNLLLPLLRMPVGDRGISWFGEIWPFQWKIAVSWLCDYFIFQLFTPVIFAFRGPVEAGRMGVSMSVVLQMSGMMLAWMSTKSAPFGSLIAARDTFQLDRLFFRALKQSLSLFSLCASLLLMGVMLAPHIAPKLAQRIVDWPVFLLLLLTGIGSHVVQSEAIYLRAHKCEPFLVQSVLIAASTAGVVTFLAKHAGLLSVSLGYFIVLGAAGSVSATIIFLTKRAQWSRCAALERVG